ncbi:hypothetical protein CEXT_595101 [Caerostris extrusa]|uniref:Uncharacterized protein n=1 Tax=Caerostris extrusa TaxID=172846 RepID=A0AAV4PIJ4_CAEEX|nr:hypothetical protein CEXT_595101 [Caerostris extrusa]
MMCISATEFPPIEKPSGFSSIAWLCAALTSGVIPADTRVRAHSENDMQPAGGQCAAFGSNDTLLACFIANR